MVNYRPPKTSSTKDYRISQYFYIKQGIHEPLLMKGVSKTLTPGNPCITVGIFSIAYASEATSPQKVLFNSLPTHRVVYKAYELDPDSLCEYNNPKQVDIVVLMVPCTARMDTVTNYSKFLQAYTSLNANNRVLIVYSDSDHIVGQMYSKIVRSRLGTQWEQLSNFFGGISNNPHIFSWDSGPSEEHVSILCKLFDCNESVAFPRNCDPNLHKPKKDKKNSDRTQKHVKLTKD